MYFFPLDGRRPWSATAAAVAAKRALYEGFKTAADAGVPSGDMGLLADEESCAAILRDASDRGFMTACATGGIGDATFDVEKRHDLIAHAATCAARYWKVVVHYNPESSPILNLRQTSRLRRLSNNLREAGAPRLLCDLVVPPTRGQIAGGIRAYEQHALPQLTARAIAELVDAGADPSLWAIEGLERPGDYRAVVEAAACGEQCEGLLVRAAGHGDAATRARMAIGLTVPGVVGVVLGRAVFWDPVMDWLNGRRTRGRAVAAVAGHFRAWMLQLEASAAGADVSRRAPDSAAVDSAAISCGARRPDAAGS